MLTRLEGRVRYYQSHSSCQIVSILPLPYLCYSAHGDIAQSWFIWNSAELYYDSQGRYQASDKEVSTRKTISSIKVSMLIMVLLPLLFFPSVDWMVLSENTWVPLPVFFPVLVHASIAVESHRSITQARLLKQWCLRRSSGSET